MERGNDARFASVRILRKGFAMRRLIALATVASLMVLGLTAGAGPTQAKVFGRNGEILFARYDPNQDDSVIYTINPDGSDLTLVLPFALECPNWSPNGTEIATCGGLGATSVIVDPDSGTYRELFAADPSLFLACPVWSPDAKRLACDQFQSPVDPSRIGLYTLRASDGGGIRRVTSIGPGGDDRPEDFSPDGKRIVFIRADPTRPIVTSEAVFVVNTDGTGLHRLSPWGYRGFDMAAGWSPDGKTILFSSNGNLFRVHPDGSGLAQISLAGITGWSFAFQPGWSPDGTKIVFSMVDKTSPEGIFTANSDGTDVQQLTVAPSDSQDDGGDWGPHPASA